LAEPIPAKPAANAAPRIDKAKPQLIFKTSLIFLLSSIMNYEL